MKTIDEMIADILRREGGYNDVHGDLGGATKLGISLRYAKGIGLDLDHDGDVDKDDIRMVTPEIAAQHYKDDFFLHPRISRLPETIQPLVFDAAVNMGPPRAIALVQHVVNLAGFGPMEEDGVIGPGTRRAAELAQAAMGPFFNNAIVCEREAYHRKRAAEDPTQEKFLHGWINRSEEFMLPTGAA